MSTFASTLTDPAVAPVFGFTGLAAQMIWPLFRNREAMLAVQLCASCSYATSYSLMGQSTATAVCLLGATQTVIVLLAGNRLRFAWLGYVFLPMVLAFGVATYSGLSTILAVVACCLIMIGRMQPDTLRMRGVQLGAFPFGAAHDVVVGAWPCLAGAVVSVLIAFTAFRRELRTRHHGGSAHDPAQESRPDRDQSGPHPSQSAKE